MKYYVDLDINIDRDCTSKECIRFFLIRNNKIPINTLDYISILRSNQNIIGTRVPIIDRYIPYEIEDNTFRLEVYVDPERSSLCHNKYGTNIVIPAKNSLFGAFNFNITSIDKRFINDLCYLYSNSLIATLRTFDKELNIIDDNGIYVNNKKVSGYEINITDVNIMVTYVLNLDFPKSRDLYKKYPTQYQYNRDNKFDDSGITGIFNEIPDLDLENFISTWKVTVDKLLKEYKDGFIQDYKNRLGS